ncbi:MAG TPA: Ig-like domain-containing protein [Gemmatimonadota bacterium]|nr:Ig-like domain-containing protein [Gemmatimonadota bacterium]
MRFPRTVSALGLALGLTVLACSSSDGPTSIEIPIATIEIRSGGCFVEEGASCPVLAEARTADGVLVSNPILRWFSSNTSVASVVGESATATIRALAIGNATVTVTDTTGDISDDMRVTVLRCSKC